ncbi:uncharacterized protein LOC133316431 [Gastrolobium bilobum]|uniref:uncharacterized protein LOC133316431 n=1 Tax=Gastrolobium bilobum TaxID=150636 RepID=UPI002AB21DE8|nr:uncharacterized protein LOC133316431 [Gastrolobium bilobum]
MEKLILEENQNQNQISKAKSSSSCVLDNSKLWDCGSTLYDSFELNSFKRQLDSAIANCPRTLSMSHLPERRFPLQPLPEQQPPTSSIISKKPFKISRSLQKFLRSFFKSSSNKSTISSTNNNTALLQVSKVPDKNSKERFYVLYDKSGPVLSTIPEVPEFEIGALSPEISSLVRRSASERFTATAIGISCT